MSMREEIEHTLMRHDVVVFMKGTRETPECSASAFMVDLLNGYLYDYKTIDVLASPGIVDAVGEYSNDSTIPQLYVNRKLVGGCDIVLELSEAGKLGRVLGAESSVQPPAPEITVEPEAVAALRDFAEGAPIVVRMKIDTDFNATLDFGEARDNDVVVESGEVKVVLDRGSASRAKGITIRFVDDDEGGAFRIDNRARPVRVKSIELGQLKQWMHEGATFELFDARTNEERVEGMLPGAHAFDDGAAEYLANTEKETPLVVYCTDGERSSRAARHLMRIGFKNVYELAGGLARWAQ